MKVFKNKLFLGLGAIILSLTVWAAVLTDLSSLVAPDFADVIHVVDVSDTSASLAGTSKKATLQTINDLITANNTIIINELADFAVQDGTTITLEDDKYYKLGAAITTSKRFILGNNVSIESDMLGGDIVLEYTGTGDMFTGVDFGTFLVRFLLVRCSSATQIFNLSDTTPKTSTFLAVNLVVLAPGAALAAEKFGTFTDLLTVQIESSSGGATGGTGGINDGISLVGSIGLLSISKLALLSNSATFVGLDLGTAVKDTAFEVENMVNIGLTAGSIGISGLTNSGNIGTGILGAIRDSEFLGAITPLSGIDSSDIRLNFFNSTPVPDSSKAVETHLSASQTVTINTQSVFEPIGGVLWTSDIAECFTTTTAGVAAYVCETDAIFQVVATATLAKDGGGADELQMAIAKNGTESTKTISTTENNAATSVTSVGLFSLSLNDTISVEVANDDGTTNIIASRAALTAINGF